MNIHRSPVLLASTIALLTLSMDSLAWNVTAHICLDDQNGTADGNVKTIIDPGEDNTFIQARSILVMTEGSSNPTEINRRNRLCTRSFQGSWGFGLTCKAFVNEVHGLQVGKKYCSTGTGTVIGAGSSTTRNAADHCETWQGGGGH